MSNTPVDLLQALPRRTPIARGQGAARPSRMPRLRSPRPRFLRVALRVLRWIASGAQVLSRVGFDWITGRGSEERTAEHVVKALRGMGPVSNKVAMQLAYRFDLLPVPTALALARLEDHIPPLSQEVFLDTLQRAVGRPLDEVFSAIDPAALGSRVLRCTYQAVLADGRPVMIRMRPPGMREALVDEITALGLVLQTTELLSIVRPGFFRYLNAETSDMLLEEADFRQHERSARLFAQRLRRDRIDHVQTPESLGELTTDDVLIAARAEGLWLEEVIGLVEDGDPKGALFLANQGINPEELSRRLLHLCWWEQLEGLFFHADPTPFDLLACPDNNLTVLHFADTAVATSRNRRLLQDLYRRLDDDDGSGVAEVLIQFLSPLPFIDTHAFFKRVEGRVWTQLFALRDKQSPWWERTTAGLWAALLTTTREDGVQVHQEVIRIMRSSMMFEAMAFRIHPRLDLIKEWRRYRRGADRRAARRWEKDGRDAVGRDPRPALIARISEVSGLVQRATFFLEVMMENLPIANLAMPRKAAYVAVVVLHTALLGVLFTLAGAGMRLGVGLLDWNEALSPSEAVNAVVGHPAYGAVVGLLVLLGIRRVMFRLNDNDPGGGN